MEILKNVIKIIVVINLCLLTQFGFCNEINSRTFTFKITPVVPPPMVSGNTKLSIFFATEVQLDMVSQSVSADSPLRQRNPQLSEGQLAIVGIDENGIEITRSLIPDPRFIRSESIDKEGQIVCTELIQNQTNFSVTLPDDQKITTIEVYHPHWDGEQYLLQFQGKVDIRR